MIILGKKTPICSSDRPMFYRQELKKSHALPTGLSPHDGVNNRQRPRRQRQHDSADENDDVDYDGGDKDDAGEDAAAAAAAAAADDDDDDDDVVLMKLIPCRPQNFFLYKIIP